jgi:hypothetical protein
MAADATRTGRAASLRRRPPRRRTRRSTRTRRARHHRPADRSASLSQASGPVARVFARRRQSQQAPDGFRLGGGQRVRTEPQRLFAPASGVVRHQAHAAVHPVLVSGAAIASASARRTHRLWTAAPRTRERHPIRSCRSRRPHGTHRKRRTISLAQSQQAVCTRRRNKGSGERRSSRSWGDRHGDR